MIEQMPEDEGTPATTDTVAAGAAFTDTASTDTAPADADGFDRARVMRLIDQLERDIAAVEMAMAQVEAGEHEAFAATVAPLELRFVD